MPQTTFGTRLIGQTEKTLAAILHRRLEGTGLDEQHWIVLNLAAGERSGHQLDDHVVTVLHIASENAASLIGQLVQRGLLDGTGLMPTAEGRAVLADVQHDVAQISDRLWGDLPAADLETAARVLTTVLGRARAELARTR